MPSRSSLRLLIPAAVLVGSLTLLGCPKRPEVVQAPPAPAGPGAPAAPAPAPAPPPGLRRGTRSIAAPMRSTKLSA